MSASKQMPWTDEEMQKAKGMRDQGYSAREIAKALPGRSRSAVLGMAHRAGWEFKAPAKPTDEELSPRAKVPDWTEAEIEAVKTAWIAGKSAAEISGDYPGRSKGAVVSLIYRSGLKRVHATRPEKVKKAPKPKAVKKEAPAKRSEQIEVADKRRASCAAFGAKAIEAIVEPANDTAILLWKRGRYQCAWPVGDGQGAQMMCCGRPVDPEATETTKSYCSKHRAIASAGVKQVQKVPREGNVIARRGPSRSVWDGGRVA